MQTHTVISPMPTHVGAYASKNTYTLFLLNIHTDTHANIEEHTPTNHVEH